MTAVDEYTPHQKAVWEISMRAFEHAVRRLLQTGIGKESLEYNFGVIMKINDFMDHETETRPGRSHEASAAGEALYSILLLLGTFFENGGTKELLLSFIDLEEIATTNPSGAGNASTEPKGN
jgi:hypothetical protein